MEREKVVEFFQKEMQRLVDEEHVVDLFKASCAEKLATVECRINKAVSDYLDGDDIMLSDKEIPEGGCVALALWGTSSSYTNDELFENEVSFAHRLAKEGGQYGKNIAAQILDRVALCNIDLEDFFSDEYAEYYDEKYASDAE